MIVDELRDIKYISFISPVNNIYIAYVNEGCHEGRILFLIDEAQKRYDQLAHDSNIIKALLRNDYHKAHGFILDTLNYLGFNLRNDYNNDVNEVLKMLVTKKVKNGDFSDKPLENNMNTRGLSRKVIIIEDDNNGSVK